MDGVVAARIGAAVIASICFRLVIASDSEAIQFGAEVLDCFVAIAPRNDG